MMHEMIKPRRSPGSLAEHVSSKRRRKSVVDMCRFAMKAAH
jgi:hypothetical protein